MKGVWSRKKRATPLLVIPQANNLQAMTSEVIIDVQPKEISIALLEDKQLVEYQKERREASFSVGNIYVAKVR